MIRKALALAGACVAMGAVALSAPAAANKPSGELTIQYNVLRDELNGKLIDELHTRCVPGRRLRFSYNDGSGFEVIPDVLYTNDFGRWVLNGAMGGIPKGLWYVKAPAARANGSHMMCPALKSETFRVRNFN